MTQWYQKGWAAASHGWKLHNCPFKIPSTAHLAIEWCAGWHAYHQMRAA